ncbi:hypothetical protein X798_03074 [Onchocerca flexuosa]|uniref:Uncharacterized protein n=1 Tax=Onchocerca flexuosa TaxID=387005 RepID=A0A238BZ78_9BILA|nr:hypothetical protein X798_03074 [Onchocerca flexuosa]
MLAVLISLQTTSLVSGRHSTMKCYACTTIDADGFLDDIQDWSWKKWLENIRSVPKMKQCGDKFDEKLIFGETVYLMPEMEMCSQGALKSPIAKVL